jgi:hypothetical protein
MDCAVNASSSQETGIGGIDHGINILRGDVSPDKSEPGGLCGMRHECLRVPGLSAVRL